MKNTKNFMAELPSTNLKLKNSAFFTNNNKNFTKKNLYLSSLGFNKAQKIELKNKENENVFKTAVHFDKNVIIKENSQFLPKIKNIVNEYQTEKFKKSNKENNILSSIEANKKVNLSWLLHFPLNIIKKGNLLNSTLIEQLFLNPDSKKSKFLHTKEAANFPYHNLKYYSDSDSKKKNNILHLVTGRNKNSSIYQYLYTISKNTPTGNGNSITPKLNKKYGILLKYNKIISYSFLKNKPAFQLPVSPYIPSPSPRLSPSFSSISMEENINKKNKQFSELFNKQIQGEKFVEELYKLLFFYFKSIYCLISKPVISITPDKIKIQLFYYLTIPKKSIIRLFAIHYLNSYKNKWIKLVSPENHKNKLRIKFKNMLKKNNNKFLLGFEGAGAYLNNNNSNKFLNAKKTNYYELNNKVRLPYINGKARKLISRFKSKPNNLRSILFNLVRFNITRVFTRKFKLICKILSNKFNKPVELELIRLHNPYLDSNILANLLQLIIKNKKRKPKKAIDKIYNKNQVKKLNDPNLDLFRGRIKKNKPAFLSGLNFYINGRLMGEPIVPRLTTKTFEKGATATGKVNFLDVSSITKKNKKGAYTIKVISAQNFF